jgi:hypothetical protein
VKRHLILLLAAMAIAAPPAQAEFNLTDFRVAMANNEGGSATQAGSHPFSLTTSFGLKFRSDTPVPMVDGKLRDALFEQTSGLVADATAIASCATADFLHFEFEQRCSPESIVGMQAPSIGNPVSFDAPTAIYNLPPPPGTVLRLGWKVRQVPIVVDLGIEQAPDYRAIREGAEYNGVAATIGVNQTVGVFASIVELWGVPGDSAHDRVRGECAVLAKVDKVERKIIRPTSSVSTCPSSAPELPFLTLPRSCEGPAITRYEARSWQEPDKWVTGFHEGPLSAPRRPRNPWRPVPGLTSRSPSTTRA